MAIGYRCLIAVNGVDGGVRGAPAGTAWCPRESDCVFSPHDSLHLHPCGTQYPPSEAPPDTCLICTDERQFVPASGQSWTTLERLRNAHSNKFRRLAAGLTTIETFYEQCQSGESAI
jgi:hypothetical protein